MRVIWSGTISFGLVSVPVLMAALRESVERTQKQKKKAKRPAKKAS